MLAAMAAGPAAAADLNSMARPSVFDLALGRHVSELVTTEFADFACGTNGGSPSLLIAGFAAFARCPAEKSGLHEVYFRYDDEREYIARANSLNYIESFAGTKEYDQNVIVSALFDDAGILQGVRIVSDPRVPADRRAEAYTLSGFLIARFRIDDSDCRDLPASAGETPVGTTFVKRECAKTLADGTAIALRIDHYRRPGQNGVAVDMQVPTTGEFWSATRLDLVRRSDPAADRATLERVKAAPPRAADPAAQARNCAACDLHGVLLKRQKLANAVLRGADLSGANLHAADLRGADLTGANLSGANLNKADLRQAKLAGAKLNRAMLFAARLDGAQLAGSDLSEALMGQVQLISANLTDSIIQSADLRGARLADADLSGADLSGSRLDEVRGPRANLSRVAGQDAVFARAQLRGARLNDGQFAGADFYGADLGESDLSGADFADADLATAVITNTKRERATFAGARMPDGSTQAR